MIVHSYIKPPKVESNQKILINSNVITKTDELGNTLYEYEQKEVSLAEIISKLIENESVQDSD